MSVHFEERSGVIPCKTAWGSWSQTMEEVFIEVNVPPGTPAKEIKCTIGSKQIELRVKDQQIFKVWLFTECLRSRQDCFLREIRSSITSCGEMLVDVVVVVHITFWHKTVLREP